MNFGRSHIATSLEEIFARLTEADEVGIKSAGVLQTMTENSDA